jgi:hypothetical protein
VLDGFSPPAAETAVAQLSGEEDSQAAASGPSTVDAEPYGSLPVNDDHQFGMR